MVPPIWPVVKAWHAASLVMADRSQQVRSSEFTTPRTVIHQYGLGPVSGLAVTTDLQELLDALHRAGVPASVRRGRLTIDGVNMQVEVKQLRVVTPTTARGLEPPSKGVLGIVAADRISEEARAELSAHGWGWVDRRGHVRVWTKGLRISSDIDALRSDAPAERFVSVFPPVGIEVALALLTAPERKWTVKELASATGRAAGGVSERLRRAARRRAR